VGSVEKTRKKNEVGGKDLSSAPCGSYGCFKRVFYGETGEKKRGQKEDGGQLATLFQTARRVFGKEKKTGRGSGEYSHHLPPLKGM